MTLEVLESILDTDTNIADKLDREIVKLKEEIRDWICKYAYINVRTKEFRKAIFSDFDVDDELFISVYDNIDEICIYDCPDIPQYIRFKYVGSGFKMHNCGCKKGDISFMLDHLSKKGEDTLEDVFIQQCQFKSIGNWSKQKLLMFVIENNPHLKMKISELPKIDISLQYVGNSNKFKLSEVKSKLRYPNFTCVELDDEKQNTVTNESILNTDLEVQDKIKDKTYYIALFAKKLVETYKKTFDLKEIYFDDRYDYIYLYPDFPLLDKLRKVLKLNAGDNGPERRIVQEIIEPLTAKLYIEGVIKKAKIDNIAHVNNNWFTAFKMGDISSFSTPGGKYLFPAIGIRVFEQGDPMMYIDFGEEKYNKKLVEFIKQNI